MIIIMYYILIPTSRPYNMNIYIHVYTKNSRPCVGVIVCLGMYIELQFVHVVYSYMCVLGVMIYHCSTMGTVRWIF